jgi:hypothetical protein
LKSSSTIRTIRMPANEMAKKIEKITGGKIERNIA